MFLFKHSLESWKSRVKLQILVLLIFNCMFLAKLLYFSKLPFPDKDNYTLSYGAIIWVRRENV